MLSLIYSLLSRFSREEEDLGRWSYTNATGPLMNNELTSRLPSSPVGECSSSQQFSGPVGYSHNTYHGQVRHHRTPLVMDAPKPHRFTDNSEKLFSPSVTTPRRRTSNASHSGVCFIDTAL